MEFITREGRDQAALFPESIEDLIGDDNPACTIDARTDSLDLAGLGFGKPELNGTGRPMYDPGDMLKLYVYGYMNRIRSSRRLEAESRRNVEAMRLMPKLDPQFPRHDIIPRNQSKGSTG